MAILKDVARVLVSLSLIVITWQLVLWHDAEVRKEYNQKVSDVTHDVAMTPAYDKAGIMAQHEMIEEEVARIKKPFLVTPVEALIPSGFVGILMFWLTRSRK